MKTPFTINNVPYGLKLVQKSKQNELLTNAVVRNITSSLTSSQSCCTCRGTRAAEWAWAEPRELHGVKRQLRRARHLPIIFTFPFIFALTPAFLSGAVGAGGAVEPHEHRGVGREPSAFVEVPADDEREELRVPLRRGPPDGFGEG
jgi:hypothetical protein